MTDADFARIKARFPALRWLRWTANGIRGCYAQRGNYEIGVWSSRDGWRWDVRRAQLAPFDSRFDKMATTAKSTSPQTLGRCLRSLHCAIRREAETLAGMAGGKVAP